MPFRLIVLLLFCLCFTAARAQFQKGNRMIGASIGSGNYLTGTTNFTYPNTQGYKASSNQFSLSVTPTYGIFLSPSLVIGGSINLATSYERIDNKSLRDTTFSSSRASNTDLGLGVFARYFLSAEGKGFPWLQLFVNGGTGFGKTSGFSFGSDATGAYRDSYTGKTAGRFFFNTGLNLGYTRMLNPGLGLEAFAGYQYSITRFTNETASVRQYASSTVTQEFQPTQRFAGGGVNFGLGLQVYLR
jgi:hypothetical protein